MTTFREVYDKGETSYMLVIFRKDGYIAEFLFGHYNISCYATDALDSDSFAYVSHSSNYSENSKYEYYATIEQIGERLEEILKENMVGSFKYTISSLRRTLKTIYEAKKNNNTPC